MRQRRLRHEKVAEYIRAERFLELLRRNLRNVFFRMLLGGVVDEYVDAAEAINHLLDRLTAELLVADVAGDGQAGAPFVADQFRRAARVLRLVEIEDGDVRALAREQDRDSLADAAVATRHDSCFPGQSVRSGETGHHFRFRMHLRLYTRFAVLNLRWFGFGSHDPVFHKNLTGRGRTRAPAGVRFAAGYPRAMSSPHV